jgi:CRISPR-associated protein Cas2
VDLLVTYDVDTTTTAGQTRLRRVARICEAYGHRIQQSVFEVVCPDKDKLRLVAALAAVIDQAHDSIRLYQLPGGALDEVEHLGIPREIDPRGPLII